MSACSVTWLALQELMYAGERLADDERTMASYHVPPVGWVGSDGVDPPRASTCLVLPTPPLTPSPLPPLCPMQGCQCLIAIERAKLLSGKPDPDSAYWN